MYRISSEQRKQLKIDVKDKKILVELSENSRIPISELAKRVGLGRDTVNYKLNRMKKLGVIVRCYPEVRFRFLGYNFFHVFLLIEETNKEKQKQLINTIEKHPNVMGVLEYSDQWDIEFMLIARSFEEFDEAVSDICAPFTDIIIEKDKLAVIKTYYSILLPYKLYGPPTIPKKKCLEKYIVDKKDLQILSVLAHDCRQSTYEIAKHVNLSADAIGLRIKRLLNTGIINKFTILPNLSLLNCSWYTFVMRMKVFTKQYEAKFKTYVQDHPYIIRAEKTLGDWDVLVYIIVQHPKEFHRTVKEIKNKFSDTIKSYATFVAYKEHMFNPMPEIIGI